MYNILLFLFFLEPSESELRSRDCRWQPRLTHEAVDGSRGSRTRPTARADDVPPALHSNPITAVKWDYVSSNAMIEHHGRVLAGKHANAAPYSSRRCVACETTRR